MFSFIFEFLLGLFAGKKRQGELTVTGADSARFELKKYPNYVHVEFCDDPYNVPCDQGSDDWCDWEIERICKHHHKGDCSCSCSFWNRKWVLVVRWSVAGSRKVVWEICN